MTNKKITDLARKLAETEPDELMRQELWRIQLFTENVTKNYNTNVTYCDGGDDVLNQIERR